MNPGTSKQARLAQAPQHRLCDLLKAKGLTRHFEHGPTCALQALQPYLCTSTDTAAPLHKLTCPPERAPQHGQELVAQRSGCTQRQQVQADGRLPPGGRGRQQP